jgi:hypothetical protein
MILYWFHRWWWTFKRHRAYKRANKKWPLPLSGRK